MRRIYGIRSNEIKKNVVFSFANYVLNCVISTVSDIWDKSEYIHSVCSHYYDSSGCNRFAISNKTKVFPECRWGFFAKFSGVDCCFRTFFTFPGTKPFYRIGLVLGVFVILKTLFGERDIRLLSVVIVLLGICETLYGISR